MLHILQNSLFYRSIPIVSISKEWGNTLFRSFSSKTTFRKTENPFITIPEDKISIDINRYKAVGGIFLLFSFLSIGNSLPNDITSRVRISFNVNDADWMPEYSFCEVSKD